MLRFSRFNPQPATLLLVLASAMAATVGCGPGRSNLTPGERLYNQGKYSEALPLLSQQEKSKRSGTLLYQLGYCVRTVEGNDEKGRLLWEAAVPLLEQELNAPQGVTLDRLYYLAAIHMSREKHDAMRRFSRRAVDEIEKGPNMTTLSGTDWFRLARIHDWLNEPSEAEAAYRRAVSAFRSEGQADNPAYQTLALAHVADLDYLHLRYQTAADSYDEAFALLPDSEEIRPFNHGLSLLVMGRFSDSIERFLADKDEKTMAESRLAAEIARMAEEVKPLLKEDFDGMKLDVMPMGTLRNRTLESAGAFMQIRNRYSYKPGDPLVPDLVPKQNRFISFLCEYLKRTRGVQAFLDSEGLAELVRR